MSEVSLPRKFKAEDRIFIYATEHAILYETGSRGKVVAHLGFQTYNTRFISDWKGSHGHVYGVILDDGGYGIFHEEELIHDCRRP